jgi:hypothetical protein
MSDPQRGYRPRGDPPTIRFTHPLDRLPAAFACLEPINLTTLSVMAHTLDRSDPTLLYEIDKILIANALREPTPPGYRSPVR